VFGRNFREGSYYYGNKEEQPYYVSTLIDLTIIRK
jgi:hypothetical protein